MKLFIVEGTIKDAQKMNEEILEKHKSYTQKAMDEGKIFLSGLKADQSGGLFIMKEQSRKAVESYISNEPFKIHGIQEYKIIEFTYHYLNPITTEWFKE